MSLNTIAIILTSLGGAFELFGLAMVVREIAGDRARARALLDKDRDYKVPERTYPPKVHAWSLEDRSPFTMMQRGGAERQMLGHIASLANGIINLRKDTDEMIDVRTGQLLDEIDEGDAALRNGLRELLRASITERVIGVIAIAIGIVLSMAGSILSSLS